MKLEVIYDGTKMKCLKQTEVFIGKDNLHKANKNKLIGQPSWKGQYYTIKIGDIVKFDRSNNYDICYFTVEGGAEFRIDCTNPLSFFKEDHFKLVELKGNPYDDRYLKFIKKYPQYKL